MIRQTVFIFFCFLALSTAAQTKSENLVIITLDGMRWQEVFGGVDSAILQDKSFTRDSADIVSNFWSDDVKTRREKLFPFLWGTVAARGQIFGNRKAGNRVNVSNPFWFSYPGYNEIFTGYPDTAVNSNDKIPNPNVNVLEYINRQPSFKGRVAAFATWDVFPFILNESRSGFMVNADVDSFKIKSAAFQLLNDMQFLSAKPLGVRLDVITYLAAREYAKMYKPRVLYIAFDETDDYAHEGQYDQYLKSAHAADAMMADLWKTLQAMPQYRSKTTFLITCDHGRGDKVKKEWTSHGKNIEGADEIWIAVIGPGISSKGEIQDPGQIYQAQLAQTIANFLGMHFSAKHPVAKGIDFK
jgi:hypothetical protein